MKYVSVILNICIICFILSSCSPNSNLDNNNAEDTVTNSLIPSLDTFSNEKEQYAVVLLGYGYNEGSKKEDLLNHINDQYGLVENGGSVIPFVYPDDFLSFGYERISLLEENIEDAVFDLTGERDLSYIATLITLGAPEATHFELANIQDSGYTDMRIFSVFSQDDVLGTEAGSTIAIDYNISENEQQEGYETLGEIDLSYPNNVFDVIEPLINAGFDWERVTSAGLFIPALRSTYQKNIECNFFVYTDPQTGLRAENHYVLVQSEKL